MKFNESFKSNSDIFSKWSIPYLFNFILLIHLIGFLSFKMGLVDINRVILTKEGILNLEFWRLISFDDSVRYKFYLFIYVLRFLYDWKLSSRALWRRKI